MDLLAQDVRKLTWGMTKEKVKEIEGPHKFESNKTKDGFEFIYFEGEANALKCIVAFYFVQGKLFQVRYIFTEEHSEKNLFTEDFLNVTTTLDEKYGKASIEKTWINDLYKDDINDWGMALAVGHLTMYTSRDLERTKISHQITGDNYQIEHNLYFKSKALLEVVSSQSKANKSDDF